MFQKYLVRKNATAQYVQTPTTLNHLGGFSFDLQAVFLYIIIIIWRVKNG